METPLSASLPIRTPNVLNRLTEATSNDSTVTTTSSASNKVGRIKEMVTADEVKSIEAPLLLTARSHSEGVRVYTDMDRGHSR